MQPYSTDFENVRKGISRKPIKREAVMDDIRYLRSHFIEHGYSQPSYAKVKNINLRKALAAFRCTLDMWESIPISKSMSKDEIYFRCIDEGHAFWETVKKSRSTTLRYLTSETNTLVDEEYILSTYEGYDSMLHERYLIKWDDTAEVNDIRYAFLPVSNNQREDEFRKRVKALFKDFRIEEVDFSDSLDMLSSLKNSVMYDPIKKKSVLMREFWIRDPQVAGPYFAKRAVVPILGGSTRDTGVGDPGTVLKVKLLNNLARAISERVPYSANAPVNDVNARLRRVLRHNSFLHLDFKKYGLTFPRALTNIMIEEISEVSGLNLDVLKIKDFFVEIDGETYRTERGTMLGWLDSINSLAVCALLHFLNSERELRFDFITFNDDVEIAKNLLHDQSRGLEMLRMAVVAEIASFDIPISMDKSYGSKACVFLEKYAFFDHYGLDMQKCQLSLGAHAQSLTSQFHWQAKLMSSIGSQAYTNDYIEDRELYSIVEEFFPEEVSTSLWSGGWSIRYDRDLNLSYTDCSPKGVYIGKELQKFKSPNYTTSRVSTSRTDDIRERVEELAYHSSSSELARHILGEVEPLSTIHQEIDTIKQTFDEYCFQYEGRSVDFPLRVVWSIGESFRHFDKDNPGLLS